MGAFATQTQTAASDITGSGAANTLAMFTGAQTIGNSVITQSAGGSAVIITPTVATSGAITAYTITQPANTGQTALTEIPGFKFTGGSRQWASPGGISTQRETYFSSTTYTATGSITITNAYGAYFEAPTASTNVTITNNWAAGFSGRVAVGLVAPPTGQRAFVVTEDTAYISIGSLTTATGLGAIYFDAASPGGANYTLSGDGASSYLNSGASSNIRVNNIDRLSVLGVVATGASQTFTFTQPANTNQTASTEISGFKFTGGSRQWATGAITTQRETYFSTTTYTAVGASVITNAYGAYFEAPTASTNVTITNNWALGLNGNFFMPLGAFWSFGYGGGHVRDYSMDVQNGGTFPMRVMFPNDGSTIRYFIIGRNTGGVFSGKTAVSGYDGKTGIGTISPSAMLTVLEVAATSGTSATVLYTQAANTAQTASTEISGSKFVGGSRQWSTGAIATQREHYWSTTTYTAVGASVITNAYGAYFEAPTASTNITITNNWAAGFSGSVSFIGVARTSGAQGFMLFTQAANTTQTADTEISGFKYTGGSRQWASGGAAGHATQRENYFSTTTYTGVAAYTITDAYGMYVEAPTASTNMTITRNWGLGISGNAAFSGGLSVGSLTSSVASTWLLIAAGTTGISQMRLTPGVAPSSPVDGDIYYIDTSDRLMFRRNATTAEIASISAVTTEAVVSDTTATFIFNGTTYKFLIKA